MTLTNWLFNPTRLTPHGFCLSWAPGLIALHVISDAVIALSYFSIPLAIARFVRQRPDLEYGWVAQLFVGFIVACGATHAWSILTLWSPAYGVEGLLKALTAVLSVATAVLLWPLIPKLAALPSAAQLKAANLDLDRRVAERTLALEETNARLVESMRARDEADAALASAEAQFRASFEAAAVGKVQTDPASGRIIRVNKAFADMLGYRPEELIGRSGWELTAPDDLDADREAYQAVLDGRAPSYVREKRYVTRSGALIWGRVSATIVRAPTTDEPVLTVAVVEDIDDQHIAKAALVQAKQDLEALVAERTAALAQRDLLLREVYHRVKNNLQVVDGMLLMQSRKLEDPDAVAALGAMRKRVFALGLVHHQLMGSADLRTFDVGAFLQDLAQQLQAGGSQEVTMVVDAAPLQVDLDFAVPLGLLVTELATNALKHAFPTGRGQVTVSLAPTDDGHVVLRVADNGIGILATPPGRKPSLGLTIVHGLVQQMRGRIQPIEGDGMCWEARLPAPRTA